MGKVKCAPTRDYEYQDRRNDVFKRLLNSNRDIIGQKLVENAGKSLLQSREMTALAEKALSKTVAKTGFMNGFSKFEKELPADLITEMLADVYYDALVLDESFKYDYQDSFKQDLKENLLALGNGDIYKVLKGMKARGGVLSEMAILVEKVTKEECGKKLKENKEKPGSVEDFIISDDGRTVFNAGKKEIDLKGVADIVKDKAITTIMEEQDEAERMDIENRHVEDQTAQAPVEESLVPGIDKRLLGSKPLAQYSLFKSMMIASAREIVTEHTAPEGDEVNMDMVLAETICKYTRHELFNVLRLQEYTVGDVKKLAAEYVYGKKK